MVISTRFKFFAILILSILACLSLIYLFVYRRPTGSTVNDSTQNQTQKEVTSGRYENIVLKSGAKVQTIRVELAETPDEQMKGLMNRRDLDGIDGMLFIFDSELVQSFWMKDTYIPLDMTFYDTQGNFVSVQKNAQPCVDHGFDCQTYKSQSGAKYVLETKAGFLDSAFLSKDATFEILK